MLSKVILGSFAPENPLRVYRRDGHVYSDFISSTIDQELCFGAHSCIGMSSDYNELHKDFQNVGRRGLLGSVMEEICTYGTLGNNPS